LVLSIAAVIFGRVLPHDSSTPAYAQLIPVITITNVGRLNLNDKPVNINALPNQIRRSFPTTSEI